MLTAAEVYLECTLYAFCTGRFRRVALTLLTHLMGCVKKEHGRGCFDLKCSDENLVLERYE